MITVNNCLFFLQKWHKKCLKDISIERKNIKKLLLFKTRWDPLKLSANLFYRVVSVNGQKNEFQAQEKNYLVPTSDVCEAKFSLAVWVNTCSDSTGKTKVFTHRMRN